MPCEHVSAGPSSAAGTNGDHVGIPDIPGPSIEKHLPAAASGSSEFEGRSPKRAHQGRCDQSR